MEVEDLSEKIEWEARRVTVAFRVTEWETYFGGSNGHYEVNWDFSLETKALWLMEVGERTAEEWIGCRVFRIGTESWRIQMLNPLPRHRDFMMCGLYCLGVEDEGVLAQLNSPLTAHEKLELRLSLPREFWPKTWLEDEAQEAGK